MKTYTAGRDCAPGMDMRGREGRDCVPGMDMSGREGRDCYPDLRYCCLIFCLIFTLSAQAARDPLWPIGYEPPKPEAEREKVTEPVAKAPEPPAVKPVTEQDWAEARKALVISGYTQSQRTDTGETRTQVMINRQTFAPGDTLNCTNLDIHFVWQIQAIAIRDLKLNPVKAERITTVKDSDHKP